VDAAPLICAGITTYKGIKETAAKPGEWIAISGVGGLGHLAIQYAKAMGLLVCAIDIDNGKLAHAKRVGADLVFNAKVGDPAANLKKETGGGGHSIVADPSLPLRVSYQDSGSGLRTIRCEGKLNGGGEVLHLKAVSGNIILKLGEPRAGWNTAFHAAWMPADPESTVMQAWNSDEDEAGFFEEFRRRILESWWGGVPVDADEMQKHLEHSVAPVYPNVARRAGIEGDVALRVYVSSDGRVTDLKVLGGPPILARAAVEAVQQWQYQALQINGRPTNVVTTLIVAFRLH
jgi:TonB family protein